MNSTSCSTVQLCIVWFIKKKKKVGNSIQGYANEVQITTTNQKTQQQNWKQMANQKTQQQNKKHNRKTEKTTESQKTRHINQNGKSRYPWATGIVADWTGPSFEPEGHGLHVFKTRVLLVMTYALLLKGQCVIHLYLVPSSCEVLHCNTALLTPPILKTLEMFQKLWWPWRTRNSFSKYGLFPNSVKYFYWFK